MVAPTLFGPDITVIILLIGAAAVVAHALRVAAPLVFLATGLLAGPVLGLVDGGHAAEILADLGLVFLLFLIGLELKADRVRPTLWTTLRVSPVQMVVTFLVFFGVFTRFFDLATAAVIGVTATYSSTAVVLQMLAGRHEVDTRAGRLDTGLLLFEDMTVIVVIAALTTGGAAAGVAGALGKTVAALVVVGGAAYGCSRVLFPLILPRFYDRPHAYFLQALGVLFMFIGLSELVGVSHEIGAFFAGIALAQLPGNDELHEQVRPLTELFMALFFIGIGVGLTGPDLLAHWQLALLFAGIVLVDKFVAHYGLFRIAGEGVETSFRAAVNMTQTSEFSLVLGAAAVGAGVVGQDILGLLALGTLISMMISTILIDHQDWLYSLVGTPTPVDHRESGAVVAGFGESGEDVIAVLERHVDDIVVVDPHPATARVLAETPHTHIFADIRHEEIKRRAGFYTASIVIGVDNIPETGIDMLSARDGHTVMVTDDAETADAFRAAGATTAMDREDLGASHLQDIIRDILTGGGADG